MTPDPTVLAAFDALAERLARPEAWCQGEHARNAAGFPTRLDDPRATSWCLDGAVLLTGNRDVELVIRNTLESIEPQYINWQDDPARTHPEVLALIVAARAAYGTGQGEGG